MKNTKLWRLAHRGHDPQDYLRERARLMRVDGNSRGQRAPTARRVPGEEMTTEERAAMASAIERYEAAPIVLPKINFLERRLPGEPENLSERWK